jgi:hypothetical protein
MQPAKEEKKNGNVLSTQIVMIIVLRKANTFICFHWLFHMTRKKSTESLTFFEALFSYFSLAFSKIFFSLKMYGINVICIQ